MAIAVVATVYWPSLTFGYVYDDRLLFLVDQRLRDGFASLGNIVMPVLDGTTYFRPMVLLSFVIEFALSDGNPRVSHAVNLAIHLINCALVGLLARNCARMAVRGAPKNSPTLWEDWVAPAAALLYGLHPAMVESAAWVSGRFDLMVTAFSLAALALVTSQCRSNLSWWAAMCVLFALFSKEMAITLPAIIWIFRAVATGISPVRFGEMMRSNTTLITGIAASVVIYLAIRAVVHPGMIHVDSSVSALADSPLRVVLLVAATLLFYLRLLVYPYRDTNPIHPLEIDDVLRLTNASTPSLVCLSLTLLLPLVAWRLRSTTAWLFFAAVISLLPVLNIIPLRLGGNIGENRFLALPLAIVVSAGVYGFARAMASSVDRRKALLVCAAPFVVLLVLGNIAFVRAILPIWRSDATLFASNFTQYPGDVRATASYLQATSHTPDRAAALARVERQLRGQEVAPALLTPYAVALALEGRKNEAITFFDRALEIKDTNGLPDMQTISRYAEVRQMWNEPAAAEPLIARALALRAAKHAAGDDYLISHLEMRQAILTGDITRFSKGYALLKNSVPVEMQAASRLGMTTFRTTFCQVYASGSDNAFCRSEVWQRLIQ
ncbi:hypothetical protein [Paracoccus sp. (in: a-proteobacteria)]|uniref:hypothetical protein n=1 Tax=Paracoccus sp. TaxID=267 RepID=UPI00321FD87D